LGGVFLGSALIIDDFEYTPSLNISPSEGNGNLKF
jgi:hypothetical protein